MHLPFGHKDGGAGGLPVEEVKKLRAQGKQDREIIVQLKNEGHSFQQIEQAMLQALKSGVGPGNSPGQAQGQQGQIPQGQFSQGGPPMQGMPGAGQGFSPQGAGRPQMGGPGFGPPQGNFSQGPPQGNLPTREALMPSLQLSAPSTGVVPLEAEVGTPTDLIEEVVEGVVEEKFEKADQKFEYLNKQIEKSKEDAEALKNLMLSSLQKRDKVIEELRAKLVKSDEEIEDIVIKCNALEKAFKQFLPELTEKVRIKNTEKKIEAQESPDEELK